MKSLSFLFVCIFPSLEVTNKCNLKFFSNTHKKKLIAATDTDSILQVLISHNLLTDGSFMRELTATKVEEE
jgi:hypothetical protein